MAHLSMKYKDVIHNWTEKTTEHKAKRQRSAQWGNTPIKAAVRLTLGWRRLHRVIILSARK